MEPTYKHGERVILLTWFVSPAISDVVVLCDPRTKKLLVKRIVQIKGGAYYVLGDNTHESTDSRKFGFVKRENIIGKVIFPKR